jgi:hypothetical protein
MRRRLVTLATAAMVALALAVPAGATDLQTSHVGTSCEHGGTFHFVENGTGGVESTLTVTFSNGDVFTGTPDKSNNGTNHWWVSSGAGATVTSASTDITANKLVISDFECRDGKKVKK